MALKTKRKLFDGVGGVGGRETSADWSDQLWQHFFFLAPPSASARTRGSDLFCFVSLPCRRVVQIRGKQSSVTRADKQKRSIFDTKCLYSVVVVEEQCDDVRVTWQYIKSETAAGIIHHIAYQKWLNLSIDTKRERERGKNRAELYATTDGLSLRLRPLIISSFPRLSKFACHITAALLNNQSARLLFSLSLFPQFHS